MPRLRELAASPDDLLAVHAAAGLAKLDPEAGKRELKRTAALPWQGAPGRDPGRGRAGAARRPVGRADGLRRAGLRQPRPAHDRRQAAAVPGRRGRARRAQADRRAPDGRRRGAAGDRALAARRFVRALSSGRRTLGAWPSDSPLLRLPARRRGGRRPLLVVFGVARRWSRRSRSSPCSSSRASRSPATPSALARVDIQPLGGTLQPPRATDAEGRPIALTDAGGKLTPAKQIAPGTKVTIVVTARRPGWNAWLLGKTATKRLTVTAPLAEVTSKWVTKPAGRAGPGDVQRADRARLLRRPHRARDRHVAQAAGEGQGRDGQGRGRRPPVGEARRPARPCTTSRPPSGRWRSSARRPAAGSIRATRCASRSPAKAAQPKIGVAGPLEAHRQPHVRLHAVRLGPVARQRRQAHAPAHRRGRRQRRPRPEDRAHGHVDDPARLAAAPDPAAGRGGLPAGRVRRPGGRAHRARADQRRRATRPRATSTGATPTRRPSSRSSGSPRPAT